MFQGYRIEKMMNKDMEGIKYIAEKDDKPYLLKIFYPSSMSNLQSLFGLQMRLNRLNHLKDKHIANVVDIDQHNDPPYMAAEFIHGTSLAHIKQHNPARLTEEFIRNIAPQLIRTAIVIRKQGLTLSTLALSNVMIDDANNAVILTSAITFEDRDEREELFSLAAILAQALSQNSLYKSLYSSDRLASQKFVYISGTSISFNKVLEECLHRNILQRFIGLKEFLAAMESLPPIDPEEVWTQTEKSSPVTIAQVNTVEKPKTRIEIWFWLIVITIISFIVLMLTTNMFQVLFGGKKEAIQYTGFLNTTVKPDSLKAAPVQDMVRSGSSAQTAYGELKTIREPRSADFRRNLPSSDFSGTATPPATVKPRPPSNMVFIEASTLGFGRLKENTNHNVSLSSFYISKHEVTQAEWSRFMKPANSSTYGENLPVDNVSWFDIAIYCNGRSEAEGLRPAYKIRGVGASRVVTCDFKANGYRLPTEAEWELAAKAGTLSNYSGSEDPDDVAWFRDNSGAKLHPPGGKTANDFGIWDMTGNVAEWCWDWYDAAYVRNLPTFINPNGPETGTLKTIRGGGINNGEGRNLSILWREKGDPNRGLQFVGFRLVRSG